MLQAEHRVVPGEIKPQREETWCGRVGATGGERDEHGRPRQVEGRAVRFPSTIAAPSLTRQGDKPVTMPAESVPCRPGSMLGSRQTKLAASFVSPFPE